MSDSENQASVVEQPPEWQGDPLGAYGPHVPYPEDYEAFDVERADTTARCGHYDSEEDRFDADVRACNADAVYQFKVRDPETFAWTFTLRCEDHADGPDLEALALPRATKILWQDAAEAYVVCGAHYEEHKRDQWAGTTPNPDQDDLREYLRERIENGTPCAFCKRDTREIA
jgi:hypothetical protein